MCASLPGWTPALQSLPGLESKEVKRSSWEAGVYIVYIYICTYVCIYIYSQFGLRKPNWHSKDAYTHRDFSFARWFDTLSKMQGHSFFAKGFECYRRYRWIVNAKVRFGHLLWHSLRAAFDALLTWTLWTIPAGAKGWPRVTRGHEGWRQVQLNMLLCQSHGFTGFTKIHLSGFGSGWETGLWIWGTTSDFWISWVLRDLVRPSSWYRQRTMSVLCAGSLGVQPNQEWICWQESLTQ